MKVCILTLGCKVNQYESDALANVLEQLNHEVCFKLEKADFFIVNTCAVTNEAERKSRQTISKIKKVADKAKIFVCGCASQHNANRFADLEGVTFVSGFSNKLKIVQKIEKSSKKKIEIDELSTVYEDNLIAKKTHERGWLLSIVKKFYRTFRSLRHNRKPSFIQIFSITWIYPCFPNLLPRPVAEDSPTTPSSERLSL